MKLKTLSVTEVSSYLKKIIDNDFILNNLSVKGEISNLKYHGSGHIYFSLKDEVSKINCVMFKSKAILLDFDLEEGMEVEIKGRVSIYNGNGSLQLYCDEIKEEGLGELFIKFERLKEKLSKEGLFDEINKRELPKYPKRIGIVTSNTGAAIKDIINVARRRNSKIDLVLYPAKVQGEGAYREVIEGINYFNYNQNVDIIIIGRGGGSIEELWNFNEEELAYEIFNSSIPIISAVGHEVDYTISDFVADVRAATPSQGAEIAVPREEEMNYELELLEERLNSYISNLFKSNRDELNTLNRVLKLNSPEIKIVNSYNELDTIHSKLSLIMKNRISLEKEKLKGFNSLLMARNPISLLEKGYVIIEDENGIISSKNHLENEKEISILFKDGKVRGSFTKKK
ncbi:MAG: exodeoxyribonuclease VII large subunit [Clostridium sp.]